MFERWRQARSRRKAVRGLLDARQAGHGVYRESWESEGGVAALVEAVTVWCRETMAGSRRPHGVALFDLKVAWDGGERELALLEPDVLYGEVELAGRLAALLPEGIERLSAVLFSWGDAAFAAMAAERAGAVPGPAARS